MTGIKIPVSAEFNTGDTDAAIARLNEQMNKLAATVAQANKVKFSPIDRGTSAELKQVEDRFKELLKVSSSLRERVKATGQGGASFGDIDWNRMYEDPAIRAKRMQQAYQHVTGGTKYAVQGPAPAGPAPAQPPGAGGSGGAGHGGGHGGSGIGGVFGGAAGAGLRAMGPIGGVAANAASAGAMGGIGAGMMGLLGGLAALAVGKGVSAVMGKVGAAGQEGIGYDTLKRTLGDVNVSFGVLRESLRAASNNIDVTFEESQKLGSDFAKLSGMTKEQYKTLAEEVTIGGGFGRSMGVDPSQSNQFFAQMRQFRVTEDATGSRRLALQIGEAVAKSGSTAKTDEMLSAIATFASTQARAGLATPNVEGYAGALSGMVGSRIPGLDPTGASSILSRANSAIMSGGANGEAGQNFLYSVLGKKNGLDPVQTMLLQQQGAFGSGRSAFGGQLYKGFSAKFGGGVGNAANNDEMNLPAILGGLQKLYAGKPSLLLNATARTLGINETQAMAVHTVGANDLNGMTNRMGRLGLNFNDLSGTGISALSQIQGGSMATLNGQADALRRDTRKPLTSDEMARLNTAQSGGNVEKLKDILTELTYSREQEQTEGSKTRESIQQLDKRMQELATKLVPLTNDMRNALVFMAGGGKLGTTGIAIGVAKAESTEKIDNLKARFEGDVAAQRSVVKSVGVNDASGELGDLYADFRKKMLSTSDPKQQKALNDQYQKDKANLIATKTEAQKRILELMESLNREVKEEERRLGKEVEKIKIDSVPMSEATTQNKQAFEQKYGSAADKAGKALGVDKKLILAQWGLETGWGKSIVPGTNNLGNIKDFSGAGVAATDNATGSVDRYKKFASTDDFADSYVSLMKRKYGGVVGTGSDAARFSAGLAGYAEDPNYGAKIARSSQGLFAGSGASGVSVFDSGATPFGQGGFTSTAMPDGYNPLLGSSEERKMTMEGTFNLMGPGGMPAAQPIKINKSVGVPRASGSH